MAGHVNHVILLRPGDAEAGELEAVTRAGFTLITTRMHVRPRDRIIGRYSVLPYYRELYTDITSIGAQLINSVAHHQYIADLRAWAEDLGTLTPRTWYSLNAFVRDEESGNGPFVLKGQTNSRKDRWNTHMFAETKQDVTLVYERLMADGLFSQDNESRQEIYIRKYEPFITYAHGIGGLSCHGGAS